MRESSSDDIVVIGVGTTDFGAMYRDRDARRSAYDLAADSFSAALRDSGIESSAVDGLVCVRVPSYQRTATYLGMNRLKLANAFEGTGRMSGLGLQYAAMAIRAGHADTVAVVYGNNGRSAGAKYGGGADPDSIAAWDAMSGMTSPGGYVSMMFRRHQHEFGTSTDALAEISMSNRANAVDNEVAVFRKEITRDEYYSAPFIAESLRLFDYCLINDGGVSLIVTTRGRAEEISSQVPVRILGGETAAHLTDWYTVTDAYYSASQDLAQRLRTKTGISPADVDCLQIYDNFTPTVLFSLEGFGFCDRGESGDWILDGHGRRDGRLPINTAGGHTAESYMQGFGLLVESVRQIRGDAGPRQVAGCDVLQYICIAPVLSSFLFTR